MKIPVYPAQSRLIPPFAKYILSEKSSARGEWQVRAEKAESDKMELVAIIKLYLLTAERGTLVKGCKKLELADIDAEARILLARLENGR